MIGPDSPSGAGPDDPSGAGPGGAESNRRPLLGRSALVTGAGRGTGRAVALHLARLGADVAVNYLSDRAAGESTAAAIRDLGRRAVVIGADVGSSVEVERLAGAAQTQLGPISILVNNAGLGGNLGRMADVPLAEIRRLFDVHTFGSLELTQRLLPAMRDQDRADVVFVTSRATRSIPRGLGGYAPSKAATEMIAAILGKEERRHGIRVNTVAPGLVDTDMGRALARDAFKVDDIRALDERSPFGRVCTPEDVAHAVEFLLTSEYVSGEVIYVDGGPD